MVAIYMFYLKRLTLFLLEWTGDLFRVYPASCPITVGDRNPPPTQTFDNKQDGWMDFVLNAQHRDCTEPLKIVKTFATFFIEKIPSNRAHILHFAHDLSVCAKFFNFWQLWTCDSVASAGDG